MYVPLFVEIITYVYFPDPVTIVRLQPLETHIKPKNYKAARQPFFFQNLCANAHDKVFAELLTLRLIFESGRSSVHVHVIPICVHHS